MKKLLVILLALSLIFAFAACGQTEAPVEEEPAAEETAEDAMVYGTLSKNGVTEDELSKECGVTFRFYDDLSSMLLALDKGDIDGIGTIKPFCDYLNGLYPGVYQVQEDEECIDQYSMAALEENTALLDTLDAAINTLKDNGTLAALEEQYITDCDPANMPAPAELPRFENGETVRVVVTGDRPPMDYMNTEGKAAGYNIALLSAIAQQTQINFELVSANSASRALMLTSGKADLVFWCYESREEDKINSGDMAEGLAHTVPYLESPSAFVTLAQ